MDDLQVWQIGEVVPEDSIIKLPARDGIPVFPAYGQSADDHFLKLINQSGKKWGVIVDYDDTPLLVLDANSFLRETLLEDRKHSPLDHAHVPIVVTDGSARLGGILRAFTIHPKSSEDDMIDRDLIFLESRTKNLNGGGYLWAYHAGNRIQRIAIFRDIDFLSELLIETIDGYRSTRDVYPTRTSITSSGGSHAENRSHIMSSRFLRRAQGRFQVRP